MTALHIRDGSIHILKKFYYLWRLFLPHVRPRVGRISQDWWLNIPSEIMIVVLAHLVIPKFISLCTLVLWSLSPPPPLSCVFLPFFWLLQKDWAYSQRQSLGCTAQCQTQEWHTAVPYRTPLQRGSHCCQWLLLQQQGSQTFRGSVMTAF